jgi:hypothetical protein
MLRRREFVSLVGGVAAEVKRAHPANSSGVLVRRD